MSLSQALARNRDVYLRLSGNKTQASVQMPRPFPEGMTEAPESITVPSLITQISSKETERLPDTTGNPIPTVEAPEAESVIYSEIRYPETAQETVGERPDPVEGFFYRLERAERMVPQNMAEGG